MNNLTIGQYVPGNSWIYKLDPRVKIILTILLMVISFILPTLLTVSIFLGLFILMFLTTRIPIIKMIKGLKPILYLILFTFILQIIYTKDKDLLYSFNFNLGLYNLLIIVGITIFYLLTKKYIPIKFIYFIIYLSSIFLVQYYLKFDKFSFIDYKIDVYEGGIEKGLFVFIRVILMVSITSLLTFSTSNMDINSGISSLLYPLKLIKIPVGVFSMMISLTLRFIPTLLLETKKIMNAQSSRGVEFSEGNLKQKITQIISLLVPIFVISFKKADDLSNAMVARGYEIDAPRTKYDLLKIRFLDYFSIFIVLGLLGVVIWMRISNIG